MLLFFFWPFSYSFGLKFARIFIRWWRIMIFMGRAHSFLSCQIIIFWWNIILNIWSCLWLHWHLIICVISVILNFLLIRLNWLWLLLVIKIKFSVIILKFFFKFLISLVLLSLRWCQLITLILLLDMHLIEIHSIMKLLLEIRIRLNLILLLLFGKRLQKI